MLSRHVCFDKYLRLIDREPNVCCHYCVHCEEDTAQHTLAECVAWKTYKEKDDLFLLAEEDAEVVVDSALSGDAVTSFYENGVAEGNSGTGERDLNSLPRQQKLHQA